VIIVNLKNNNEIIKRPINADSAIMHWTKNIIALKAQGRTIQIFDLTAKQKLKSAVMNEDVVYWKWFSEKSLGLVTDTSVYHWDVFDPTQSQPLKVFDRLPNLSVRITEVDGHAIVLMNCRFLGLPNYQLPRQ
jgi:clathrin heavy chain